MSADLQQKAQQFIVKYLAIKNDELKAYFRTVHNLSNEAEIIEFSRNHSCALVEDRDTHTETFVVDGQRVFSLQRVYSELTISIKVQKFYS